MNDLLSYLLKVSLGLAIVCVPYYFLLRNDPNLLLKRFYLLFGLAASWIIPLLVFRKPELMVNLTPTVFIDPLEGDTLPLGQALTEATGLGTYDASLTINWFRILFWTYLAGLAFMLIKNIAIIIKWNLQWRKRHARGMAFIPSDQVFTLFTRIFIPESLRDEADLENVILHERAHVEQLHFIDLMLMELTLLLTWFNPFSWLISRMIKENHEHLADRQVLSAGVSAARYRAQLMNHTLGVNVFRLGNQFNHSLTLNRFKMMKKPKRSPLGIVKLAFLVPLLLLAMAISTGMSPQKEYAVKGKVVFADGEEPAPGTSIVIANSTMGTVADRDGSFQLNVEGNPDIVFSFVGYRTLRIPASDINKRKPVKLEQRTFTVDLKDTQTGNLSWSASNSMVVHSESEEEPVIVLNGEVVLTMDNIDPESIEKIEVIKDPDSPLLEKYDAENGLILITSKEENGTILSGDDVFYIVEDMPMFPGGRTALKSYIYSKLEYPDAMKGKAGEVQVQFLVSGSGTLKDIQTYQSTDAAFEEQALAVFRSMPDWNPGKQRGKPVAVQVVVPVRFDPERK